MRGKVSHIVERLGCRARMSGEERRHSIVETATRLFSQKGFSGTTTREIAQAAGVSEAIIFRHFATKEELYAAIVDFKSQHAAPLEPCEMVHDAWDARDDRAVFEGIALGMLRHHEQDEELMRLLLFSALDDHRLTDMFIDRCVRQMQQTLGEYVRERQAAGAFRADLDALLIIRFFLGATINHALNNNLFDKSHRLLKINNEDAARAFADILLHGITRTAPVAAAQPQPHETSRNAGKPFPV